MSVFSAEWLILREPYDMAARNPVVLKAAIDAFAQKPVFRILDLGCGSGSILRTIAPRLNAKQDWRLVDYDAALLARAEESAAALNVKASATRADLNRDIESVLVEPADLVTMSALLDLVSDEWLERFANCVADRGLHVYAALSYDGRIEMSPSHPLDERIIEAVNLHQRSDKGFGPALGPSAAAAAIEKLRRRGFFVHQGPADWKASERDVALQIEIVRGWAGAARETGAMSTQHVEDWLAFRQQHIAVGRPALCVGHADFFAVPPSA
jgi:SAM-dependent methyltransferase